MENHLQNYASFRKVMKLSIGQVVILLITWGVSFAAVTNAQKVLDKKITLEIQNQSMKDVLNEIQNQVQVKFAYKSSIGGIGDLSINVRNERLADVLSRLFSPYSIGYELIEDQMIVIQLIESNDGTDNRGTMEYSLGSLDDVVSGSVTSESGEPLPGVNVLLKGTTEGTVTDVDGKYSLRVSDVNGVLIFSYIGYVNLEVPINGRNVVNATMAEDVTKLEEVVVVGYGTQRKSDLTGSIIRADIDALAESPATSIFEGLRGVAPGLDVGQITQAGQEPSMLIRGKSTLAGSSSPLIVVDGVIFRGRINDINPADIATVDILKDVSAASVYGSQATNGVILITTKSGGGVKGKPVISYSGYFAISDPVKELAPPGAEGFYKKTEESDIFQSRTAESGYLEKNPNWDITSVFSVNEEGMAYQDGRTTNWYDVLTNDFMYSQNHNISISNSLEKANYLISIGYNEQQGYLHNEKYERLTGRINITNYITDWLEVGVQSFIGVNDYSGATGNTTDRYIEPYATDTDANGVRYRTILAGQINPYLQFERDDFNERLALFGNVYAKVDFPFLQGLSYKVNVANNYQRSRQYRYRSYAADFQGEASKSIGFNMDQQMDNILSYNRTFNNTHNIQLTLLYGAELQTNDNTEALSRSFINGVLGYNRLQVGSSEQQRASSGAWKEASLYSMARLFYGFKDKYLITGTIRRDGFSGLGKGNKFGVFPSVSVAWNVMEESFANDNLSFLSQLKLRTSYGTVGNRTIGRYQTLATVGGNYGFIDLSSTPLYTQRITSLESPNLKWERKTGTNVGIDFGILKNRVVGSIDYYNTNTTNLFYRVDIPAISRYTTFPDNLGKLHNRGLEIMLTTVNIAKSDLQWSSSITYTRNRNQLKELLGFDLDGDGVEDDLISEGLFIGQSIDAIFDYEIDGKWQLGDEIPAGQDVGANRPIDRNNDGVIDPRDKTIIGFSSPAYQFAINNTVNYKNFTLKVSVYSIQGGKNYYLGPDNYAEFDAINSEMHFRYAFPAGLDYWTPENPNGRYQRPGIYTASGARGNLYGDRSFVRLQNVSLSYNIPQAVVSKAGLKNARIYFSGKNLLTLTKWNGWDPETNQTITRKGVPVLKSYTIGINVDI